MLHKLPKIRIFQTTRLVSALLITVLLFGFQPVQTTRAATITVDTLSDENDGSCSNGDCSLRDAIEVAAGGDTIDFSVTGTISLSLGYLAIDKNLVISGPGPDDLTIRGDDTFYVFMIDTGVDATISGVTINHASTDSGGGVFNWAGILTLSDVIISGNEEGSGAGIFNLGEDGTITVENSTITGNSADLADGGGIHNGSGSVEINNCTIIGNDAVGNGGGIYNGTGTVTIQTGSTIGEVGTGNTAGTFGGGIFNDGGTVTIDGSTVSGNDAANGCGIYNMENSTLSVQNGSLISGNSSCTHGGGIHNKGNATINNSTISENNGGNGGGIFNEATLNIQNGSIVGGAGEGNSANYGGGIYNYTGTTTVDGSTISGNSAVEDGGGIFNDDTLYVQNGSAIGGTGAANTAKYGGGIYNYNIGAAATVSGSEVNSNTVTEDGGGIYNEAGLNIQDGSTINDNTATSGGGIYNASGVTTVDGSTVSSNTVTSQGGGIYNYSGTTTMDGSTITGNSAEHGGGMRNRGTLNVLAGCEVSGNTASTNGGGIFTSIGTTTIDRSSVNNNTAPNGSGGGVFNGGSLIIEDSTISANSAIDGGGIFLQGTVTLLNSTLSGNSAVEDGGGIYNSDNMISLNLSTITDNTADSDSDSVGQGGGIYVYHFSSPATANFKNTIISGNHDLSGSGAEDCHNSGGTLASQDYNLTGTSTGCSLGGANDQAAADAILLPLADNGGDTKTHALGTGSPAINQIPNGINGCGSTYTTDQRGEARPYYTGGSCDIGSFEKSFPEMDVIGNAQSIPDGDSSPSLTDHTDFGSTKISGSVIIRTFTIENTGGANLYLTNTPHLAISGPHAVDFSVISQPSSIIGYGGGTTTFQVQFDPSGTGLREATISIDNNDLDENPYSFAVQGTGTNTFSDVTSAHWAYPYIEAIADAGLTSGYPDGTYRPENRVTRAEMAVFLLNALGISPGPLPVEPSFSDISGHWAETFIEELADQGITGGYPDGTYRPENRVTRAEMAVFLLNALGISPGPLPLVPSFSDISGHWAETFIEDLADQGITGGYPDGTYRPDNRVTRAEMAVFLVNTFGLTLPW